MGSEGALGAEEDEEAAIHISLDGYEAMGIGYMGLQSKMWDWMDG